MVAGSLDDSTTFCGDVKAPPAGFAVIVGGVVSTPIFT